MITFACCLWDANEDSFDFSRMYDERWVEKLYRGIARNCTWQFRFVCFTDIDREFSEPEIQQQRLEMDPPSYGALIEPLKLDTAVIVMGLDTIITGNIDHLVEHAMKAEKLAAPRDPFYPETVCNGVVIAPRGSAEIFRQWQRAGQPNDMEFIRRRYEAGEIDVIDDLFPGEVVSFKGTAKHHGPEGTRIVYFHGKEKPHELVELVPWIAEAWS